MRTGVTSNVRLRHAGGLRATSGNAAYEKRIDLSPKTFQGLYGVKEVRGKQFPKVGSKGTFFVIFKGNPSASSGVVFSLQAFDFTHSILFKRREITWAPT